MSFFTRLFHRKKQPELVDRKPAAKPEAPAEPKRSAPVGLDELRFRARTGDVQLTERHHSGSFK